MNYRENIKNDLLTLDISRFYLKYIIKSHNWYFSEYLKIPDEELIDKMDLFKEIVTQNFHISFHSVQIVGSAKMGVSLSPKKLLEPFHSESSDEKSSDIDIAIISEKLFNSFWDKLRHSREKVYQRRNYNNIAISVYRGYINDKDLNMISDTNIYLKEFTSPTNLKLQDQMGFIHPISYRLYRSWEDLEDYQLAGIYKAKKSLEEQKMFSFGNNKKTVNEIYNLFDNEKLIVDDSYQRRSVWSEKDKVRLVETILLNYIIPELFFWKAETDPETGDSITHIVDGQQRIKALYSFVTNEYKLKKSYLLNNEIKEAYGDKFFSEFDPDTKKKFWNYDLMIIEIDTQATKDDIITMFNRLNLTDYSLNDQEKRNSRSGEFAVLARELADNPVWEEYNLFKISDIKRMKDIEFCASILLLYRNGIIDQMNQTPLNKAYEELQTGYQDAEKDKQAFLCAIETIKKFLHNKQTLTFFKKKSQLYTLFSVIFYAQRNNKEITDLEKENINIFTKLYSKFDNNVEFKGDFTEKEANLLDLLKRYKLASSEGLNKHTNRMIRYNIMKKCMFFSKDDLKKASETLLMKLKK